MKKGRINVIDLPALLNVDGSHVTRKVEAILAQDRDLSLVDGEIISSYVSLSLISITFLLLILFYYCLLLLLLNIGCRFYADRVVAEIGESLIENGQLMTQSLGARFGLGTAFLEKILIKKIASGKLKAHLQNGVSSLSFLFFFFNK